MKSENQPTDQSDYNILQNLSCVTDREKTEENYKSSKLRMPLSNIRLFYNNDDYSKNKIMELQEELLRLRKELSQKQCQFSKEKSNLLNRLQILTEQCTEIKHRQQSLLQLNQTLELALKTKEQIGAKSKDNQQIQSLKGELQGKNKMIKELKRTLQESKNHFRHFEDQKYRLTQEKDKQIGQLRSENKKLLAQREAEVTTLKNLLSSQFCNKETVSAIYKALNIKITKDLSFDDIQAQSNYFDQSPITKRKMQGDKRIGGRSSNILDTSYSGVSNKSFIYQLNSNKNMKSQCSEDYQEQDMLLCEVCKKVFEEKEFICHMDQCREMNQLQKKRQELQRAIEAISHQQRISVSHKKSRINKFNQGEPERDNYQTERSKSKLQKKKAFYQQESDKNTKMVLQLRGNQGSQGNYQNFKSNKYY